MWQVSLGVIQEELLSTNGQSRREMEELLGTRFLFGVLKMFWD